MIAGVDYKQGVVIEFIRKDGEIVRTKETIYNLDYSYDRKLWLEILENYKLSMELEAENE